MIWALCSVLCGRHPTDPTALAAWCWNPALSTSDLQRVPGWCCSRGEAADVWRPWSLIVQKGDGELNMAHQLDWSFQQQFRLGKDASISWKDRLWLQEAAELNKKNHGDLNLVCLSGTYGWFDNYGTLCQLSWGSWICKNRFKDSSLAWNWQETTEFSDMW